MVADKELWIFQKDKCLHPKIENKESMAIKSS